MEKDSDRYVHSLLKSIEDGLQWGIPSQWSSYDFDKLRDLIYERTNVVISSNTLKRVWGRIKYDSRPSETTLNTLAQFQGFGDFREFKNSIGEEGDCTEMEEVLGKRSRLNGFPFKSRPSIIFASGAVFMLVALIALSYTTSEKKLNPDDFYFTSRKVTKGLPNSVVFEYRAQNAPSDAKIEIQQSWDKSKRQTVSRTDTVATSIYYDPGYFNAKLVVDGQVVKEHGILIPSEGWKAKLESSEGSVYFNDASVTGSGKVAIDSVLFKENGIDKNNPALQTTYRYVDDFKDLRANDLIIETAFRNTTDTDQNQCQHSSITLLMEGEVVKVPFSKLGCISELELLHPDRNISGKKYDFSKFGVDFSNWVQLSLVIKKDMLTIGINGNKVLELPMNGRINKVHGLIYRFNGSGEVKSLVLKNSNESYLEWPPMP